MSDDLLFRLSDSSNRWLLDETARIVIISDEESKRLDKKTKKKLSNHEQ